MKNNVKHALKISFQDFLQESSQSELLKLHGTVAWKWMHNLFWSKKTSGFKRNGTLAISPSKDQKPWNCQENKDRNGRTIQACSNEKRRIGRSRSGIAGEEDKFAKTYADQKWEMKWAGWWITIKKKIEVQYLQISTWLAFM